MTDRRGSTWRKWDLHVHTPASIVQAYGGESAWGKFLEELAKLPPEIKVLGINDYIFVDGYKKVAAAKAEGKLPNIDLVLPVIELRLDKFGGSKTGFSRINFHAIFSNEVPIETIESQFLSALCPSYILSPELDTLRREGKWSGVPTRQSLEDLGKAIIDTVPPEERVNYGAPLEEGFNNLCVSLDSIKAILKNPYFKRKVLTAVGKTEWADLKWTGQSIAEKKNIINGVDFVFVSASSADNCLNARKSLELAQVNSRLLDCSDAHHFSNSGDKDRLGKCFTWIKADPTFEGLRQTLFEYSSRVSISTEKPLAPLLTISRVSFSFPSNTQLVSQFGDEERQDDFCFRNQSEILFSSYLTCLIGGRGSGKSTVLNLLHEKLAPGENTFFKKHRLVPQPSASIETCVSIDWDGKGEDVEFLQQNEIERFATDARRLTDAVFSRLSKLDQHGVLAEANLQITKAIEDISDHRRDLNEHGQLVAKLANSEKELASNKALIASFQNEEYREITNALGGFSAELQLLQSWKERLSNLLVDLEKLSTKHSFPKSDKPNGYEQEFFRIIVEIASAPKNTESSEAILSERDRELGLQQRINDLKRKLDVFLRGRGLSPENLADVGKANERVAKLVQEIPTLKAQLEAVSSRIQAFKTDQELPKKYAGTVETLLAPINSMLNDLSTEVKPIELHYEFDMVGCTRNLLEQVQSLIGTGNFRIDHVESMLEAVDLFHVTDQSAFINAIPGDHKTGKALRDFYSIPLNFELFKLEVQRQLLEVRGFGRIRVQYDKRPIESTSFGQRCTAAIVVLLTLGNTPIVIDEPEAHLDSALIANYLVELVKSKKVNRQIIFATHNANFVINGDAELIHILDMRDDKCSKIGSANIEDLSHRIEILRLEGGQEAFLKREHRYGIEREH